MRMLCNACYWAWQIKRNDVEKPIAYKRIQGGIQPDITLRMATNLPWDTALLSLQFYGQRQVLGQSLPFRVEKMHGAKVWAEHWNGCLVKSCEDKLFTRVRVQFCKSYFEKPIQFCVKVEDTSATTALPIVIIKEGSFCFVLAYLLAGHSLVLCD